jgi:hypothetical protein
MGSHEDHAHPRCKREEDAEDGGGGYWGSRRRSHGKRRMKRDRKYEFTRYRN